MEKWAEIRRLVFVEGKSKRSVCRQFGIHWDTLNKILGHSEPPGYRLPQEAYAQQMWYCTWGNSKPVHPGAPPAEMLFPGRITRLVA